jgi:hypothetical protein
MLYQVVVLTAITFPIFLWYFAWTIEILNYKESELQPRFWSTKWLKHEKVIITKVLNYNNNHDFHWNKNENVTVMGQKSIKIGLFVPANQAPHGSSPLDQNGWLRCTRLIIKMEEP